MIVQMTPEQELAMARSELGGIILEVMKAQPTVRLPLAQAVRELAAELVQTRERFKRLGEAGVGLANAAYNLAQSDNLDKHTRDKLKELAKSWDEAARL